MGKQITGEEYGQARRTLASCKDSTCRNHTRNQEDDYCRPCIKAFKTTKEYERTRKGAHP